jgi:hypothetical protein
MKLKERARIKAERRAAKRTEVNPIKGPPIEAQPMYGERETLLDAPPSVVVADPE